MASVHEQLTEQFDKWEVRGRGWQVFDRPVSPEPPFVSFNGHYLPEAPVADDGRRPGILSLLFRKANPPPVIPEPEEEPEPVQLTRGSLVEFQASLPEKLDVSKEAFEQFLLNLSSCQEPIAFELIGTDKGVAAQFVAASSDAPLVRRQLQAFFPEAVFVPGEGSLASAWNATTGDEMLAMEFGLEREFMFPLASGKLDPFIGIVGALAELEPGELGLFQVLWQPVQNPWAESIVQSVTHRDGKPFFVNSPELTGAAENKVARPLYAAVVRIMVCGSAFDRIMQLTRDLAGSLRVFAHPQGNALIPLHNEEYPFEEHIEDVLRRQTRRSGMLLNSDELTGFVHLPSSAVRSPAFERQVGKTKAAPKIVRHGGLLLGDNKHAGQTVSVRLTPEQRVHHTHIIGATGTGKSTLLFNLVRQSIENGEGIAVLDPNGDLIDRILGVIPPGRVNDVVLVDPADEEYSIGFNILSAHSDLEKTLLASDLVAVFRRLSSSWGDQMDTLLQNAILVFLDSSRGGTLADLRRFLIEPAYRTEFLTTVRDPELTYYWQKVFSQLAGGKSIGPVLTRLQDFFSRRPLRNMVSQPENRLDFAHIMDSGKILLAKLPEGLLGRENSYLLGTLLVSKFQQIAMSRQAQQIEARRLFNIVIDEFANFITPSMAEILAGARKYRIGLTLAHHELHQLQRSPEVASAVLTHPYTRIVFRVGDDDAKKLAESFSYFESNDLRNLEVGQAICRVERSDYDFNLTVPLPEEPDRAAATARRQEVITGSRKKYGTARADVEAMLVKARATPPVESPGPSSKQAAPKPPAIPVAPLPPMPIVAEPPKIAEAPKPGEVLKQAEPVPIIETPKPPRDMGRGGAQHKAVQKRIKEAAETLGFRSIIEKSVLDGDGSVDLWLEREGEVIACEISFTTTIDHEVGNVTKCLKAGLVNVAVICLDPKRLADIADAVSGCLGAELAKHVTYFQPDQFIEHLKRLKPPEPAETSFGGYKIKRTMPKLSVAERKQKEDIANRMAAEALQRKK